MEFLPHIKTLFAELELMPLYHALQWWYWSTQIHLLYALYAALLIVELLIGRRVRASWRDVVYNYAFLTISITAFVLIAPALNAAVSWSAASLGGPYLDLSFDAGGKILPNIAAQVMFVFVFDFFNYWWHRLQHATPILWVSHKLHHVDQNMGVTTTMKAHPVNVVGRTVAVAFPMAVLFHFEPTTIFWVYFSTRIFEHFIHTNINCHFGWLNYLVTSPNQHRIHHSTLPEHDGKNFATYFPIIDIIFGTYCPPAGIAPPTGLMTDEKPFTLWQACMQPFVDWWQMGRRWVSAAQS